MFNGPSTIVNDLSFVVYLSKPSATSNGKPRTRTSCRSSSTSSSLQLPTRVGISIRRDPQLLPSFFSDPSPLVCVSPSETRRGHTFLFVLSRTGVSSTPLDQSSTLFVASLSTASSSTTSQSPAAPVVTATCVQALLHRLYIVTKITIPPGMSPPLPSV